MYIEDYMINLGLPDGVDFASDKHKDKAIQIAISNPQVFDNDTLQAIVASINQVPSSIIEDITLHDLVDLYGCPKVFNATALNEYEETFQTLHRIKDEVNFWLKTNQHNRLKQCLKDICEQLKLGKKVKIRYVITYLILSESISDTQEFHDLLKEVKSTYNLELSTANRDLLEGISNA